MARAPTRGRSSVTRDEQGHENCDSSGRDDGEQQVLEEKHHAEDSRLLGKKTGRSTYPAPRWEPACLLRLVGAADKLECPPNFVSRSSLL